MHHCFVSESLMRVQWEWQGLQGLLSPEVTGVASRWPPLSSMGSTGCLGVVTSSWFLRASNGTGM